LGGENVLVVDHREDDHVECLEVPAEHSKSSVLLHDRAAVACQVRDAVTPMYHSADVVMAVELRQSERLTHATNQCIFNAAETL